jgi:hypothetical protein
MSHRRDWIHYNKHLVARGKINFWIKLEVLDGRATKRRKKNGHPFVYSNELIKTMCYIRFKFHLSLRETEGFSRSLMEMKNRSVRVPCYTQVCRRMKFLQLPKELLEKKNVTDIVLDTTGLKVYGEGEWRAEKYGGKKAWKKLHLAMDPHSGKLVLAAMSNEYAHDTTYLDQALERANGKSGKVLIDGIADSGRCYEIARRYKKELLTPPKKGAVVRKEPGYERRNEAVKIIRGLGGDLIAKSIWAKLVGYNKRVIVESMMSRWKRVLGSDLKSRDEDRQRTEVRLKAMMINAMIGGQAA